MRVQPEIIIQRLESYMPPRQLKPDQEKEERENKQNNENDQSGRDGQTRDEEQKDLTRYRQGFPGTSPRAKPKSWRWAFGCLDVLRHEGKATAINRTSSSKSTQPSGYSSANCVAVIVNVQLPLWLAQTAWSLQLARASAGFNIALRSYPIVELVGKESSFIYVRNGDMGGLLRLFRENKASPFDRDPRGKTLLHVSSLNYESLAIARECC